MRCRSQMREGDDHKMHRWCIRHRSWMRDDSAYCYASAQREVADSPAYFSPKELSSDFAIGCWACGRTDVSKRPRRGKLHYPHKCPHGTYCIAGHPLAGLAGNNWPRCPECMKEKKK